ncbi:MAG: helix-turn-helix domain-containing protein [Clostridia bacterium]|nr:helix-turn-helix domain-containing protein [Clostridia bacterium]
MAVNEEKLRKTIAENIAYYRKRNHDTQQDLAEKLSYSDKSVSKWERGESTPDVVVLARMAELYHLNVNDYLQQKKVAKNGFHRIMVVLLSVGIVWLVFSCLFVASKITGLLAGYAWILFVYAAAVSCLVCVIYARMWAGKILRCLAVSVLVWTIGASLVLSLGTLKKGFVLLLIICAVMQILVLFWFIKPSRKKKTASREAAKDE